MILRMEKVYPIVADLLHFILRGQQPSDYQGNISLDYPSAHRVVKYSYLLTLNVLSTTPL